jgi:hypothetical protein
MICTVSYPERRAVRTGTAAGIGYVCVCVCVRQAAVKIMATRHKSPSSVHQSIF